MPVDVTDEILIERPRAEVWEFATDPANAAKWQLGIRRATPVGTAPVGLGSLCEFEARFLGRTLRYTYEVVAYDPQWLLTMRTSEGPFPMTTSYTFGDHGEGATRMTLRNSGDPQGFLSAATSLVYNSLERSTRRDLARLRELLT